MDESFLNRIEERLQRERRTLVAEISRRQERLAQLSGDIQAEREERAQAVMESGITETLDERQQDRIGDIDAALARIEAGNYGRCLSCGRLIEEDRLEADATTRLCADCAARQQQSSATPSEEEQPQRGRSPPDLDELNEQEVAERRCEIVRNDGQIDMQELQITVRNGVIYLEGALPSEPEHAILMNILTDVAGVQDIVDHLEIQRLAWEREDRWKEENVQDVLPGNVPGQEPYGGTDDIVLAEEEGLDYEPPDKPPPPSHRKD